MLLALVIISIHLSGSFLVHDHPSNSLLVPFNVFIMAIVTAVVGFISLLWAPQKILYWLAFANYLLLGLTTGILIDATGNLDSPYLVIWMLLTIFAGLFGWAGLATVFVAVNSLFIYLIINPTILTREFLIVYFLALETPIIISYIIWNDREKQEKSKTKAFDALAKQLSQVANKSEIVINAIDEGVVAIDANGVIQLINPAAQGLLGWDKQDAIGLDYRSVMKITDQSGKELPPEQSPVKQVLASGRSLITTDLSLSTNSGKAMLISLIVSPVKDGEVASGAIAVFRDITAEKEEERQQAEFISTASHEMRTPVAAIEGYLGLALNPNTAVIDDKARMYLEKAHEATQHLGGLFQDLLTVSRAEDGRLVPKPTAVETVAFLREIVESLAPKAQVKGLTLYFKPGGATATEEGTRSISPMFYAMVDQGHLREIADNLIDNAIKYTKQGSVVIDLKGDDEHITLSVTDTGIGIPPEDVTHLFQKFYRIDNSDTREIGGTGLGLYISRRLAESNSAKLWVESAYGKGSTFYLQLPRVSHERATELISNPPTPTVGNGA